MCQSYTLYYNYGQLLTKMWPTTSQSCIILQKEYFVKYIFLFEIYTHLIQSYLRVDNYSDRINNEFEVTGKFAVNSMDQIKFKSDCLKYIWMH